ncbi:CBS domain-containing protein [Pseudonocardia bannensis]|uniref:CBS domain-containing protein n=1 Tax=Pseudonocardia bannensis TaxID=630973 RepID=A0A848DF74_9PSEU|nr:CBS domain-containing protein [Pseudonocardia bannensis]NMH91201.1 CBS domain-containing protein [Pseudonocardia bannensis]
MPAVNDAATGHVTPSDPVRLIMNSTVATVDVGCSMLEVVAELVADEIGAVLVTGEHGPLGVLSERDVVTALTTARDLAEVQAEDVMSTEVVWADPADSVRAVGILMRDAGVRHIPVGNDREVLGVVAMRDVLSVLLAEN